MATYNLKDGGITTFEPHETSNTPVGEPDPAPQPIGALPNYGTAVPDQGAEITEETDGGEGTDAPAQDETGGVAGDEKAGESDASEGQAGAAADAPAATPAAVAHAEATGVDLTQVQGTGAGGQIIKADVVAAASDSAAE